jgi:metal-responsive CopG/Arc/MetJ family transcriptional regulator
MSENDTESHSMGLRLKKPLYEKLESRANEYGVKKSKVIHQALSQWLSMKESLQSQTDIKIGITLFKAMLNAISEEQLSEFAMTYAREMYNKIKFRLLDAKKEINFINFAEYMEPMLKLEGFGWFTKFNIREDPHSHLLCINALHVFSHKFSMFAKELLRTIFSEIMGFNFKEDLSSITENSIDLSFIIKEDT